MKQNYKMALVVEGGAMRGIYSAGVLDALMDDGYQPFDLCIGVSAGSTNLAAYLANMPKRNYHIYMTYSLNRKFINIWNFIAGSHLMDLDWLWRETIQHMRLDLQHIISSHCDYYVGITDAITGKIQYVKPNMDNLELVIKASSAVPILYRSPVMIDGHPYYDGGLSDPIPVQEAIKKGAKKMVVIRSRKRDYRMKQSGSILSKWLLRGYPYLNTTLENRHLVYNEQIEYLRKSHDGVEIIEVYPPDEFETTRLTKNKRILEKDYLIGYSDGERLLKQLQANSSYNE